MTVILGISAFYHDSAAALIVDGQVVAACQEERFSRIKHDAAFPAQAIDACLRIAQVQVDQIEHVAFYEKPIAKFDRILETSLRYAPFGFSSFAAAMPDWTREKLHIRKRIRRELSRLNSDRPYQGKIWFAGHHASHAASAFFASPMDQAAIMTFDAVGEWSTTTRGVGLGQQITMIDEIRFPHSLGLLYSAFTHHAGFEVNSGEYKLMGLAPYGTPCHVEKIRSELIDVRQDGSYQLNMDYFEYGRRLSMTGLRFNRLFGVEPRDPSSPIRPIDQDMAASIQVVVEEVMLKSAEDLHRSTGETRLCLAGGVALNCVANGRLLREGPFEEIFVQPAAGDAGGAIGAALMFYHDHARGSRVTHRIDTTGASLLGPSFTTDDVTQTLDRFGVPHRVIDDAELLADTVAQHLAAGKVVGRLAGPMEFGPRALGNRSILADPRGPDTQNRINQKIKFRESFRPFAPAVLADRASEFFELGGATESPAMMFVMPVRASDSLPGQTDFPAITHIDGSARVQTVDPDRNPDFHRLIRSFDRQTGCPMLVNTSFNVAGEPIVCSPEDAYRCFVATDIDVLVMENVVVTEKVGIPPDSVSTSSPQPTIGFGQRVPSAIVLTVFAAVIELRLGLPWLSAILVLVAVAGLASNTVASKLAVVGATLRRIASTISLAIVYYGIVAPIGLSIRLFGTGMSLGRRDAKTYWTTLDVIEDQDRRDGYRRTF